MVLIDPRPAVLTLLIVRALPTIKSMRLTEIGAHYESGTRVALPQSRYGGDTPAKTEKINRGGTIMLWAIVIVGTYVAGIYLIRLVWWQE